MNPRIVAVLASALALLAGCSPASKDISRQEIIAADKAFSAMSAKVGPRAAFLAYIAGNGKLLSDTRAGPDGVRNMFIQLPPRATLTWEPAFADVAASGEMGYTWGRYMLRVPLAKGPLIRMGTYVTIWKRQAGGIWKVVLDGGNPDGQK